MARLDRPNPYDSGMDGHRACRDGWCDACAAALEETLRADFPAMTEEAHRRMNELLLRLGLLRPAA